MKTTSTSTGPPAQTTGGWGELQTSPARHLPGCYASPHSAGTEGHRGGPWAAGTTVPDTPTTFKKGTLLLPRRNCAPSNAIRSITIINPNSVVTSWHRAAGNSQTSVTAIQGLSYLFPFLNPDVKAPHITPKKGLQSITAARVVTLSVLGLADLLFLKLGPTLLRTLSSTIP